MTADILNPLQEYRDVFQGRFKEVAEATFAELAAEARVDVEANKRTCTRLYATQEKRDSVKKNMSRWTFLCVFLWICVVAGIVAIIAQLWPTEWLIGVGSACVAMVCLLFLKVHPYLKKLKSEHAELDKLIAELKREAWQQMAPLNKLYDWDVLTRMMTKTVPKLEFDPYFTTQRLADLKVTYGWDESFNEKRSVIYSHSGLIQGNPFVICRTRKMNMGQKTYTGTKTIFWTTYERDSNGRMQAVQHSETLYATVTAPFPEYYEKTRLIYANTAAPDLIFNRQHSGMANKEHSLSYKWQRHSLRKKARDLQHADFAMMTNEEFEVAFDTSNRNNNQQFALLFTPLAQENMLNLLKDNEMGFGDDFDFDKFKMINVITPQHLQALDLDMNPEQYENFDFEQAKANFYAINAKYFRAIYFSLAPLLCVPLYQQMRPQHDIYGHDMQRHSAFWEHEALANFWGQEHFRHPSCVTDCILKTAQGTSKNGNAAITVYAYGYRSEARVTYISKLGGDGHTHQVPVHWEEYLPVTGTGSIQMSEDNDFDDSDIKHGARLNHIADVLQQKNLNIYRRHIASKVQ